MKRELIVVAAFFTFFACSPGTSDPKFVAKAFIAHLREREYSQAIQHVLPEDREKFKAEELERDLSKFPPIPTNPEILLEVDTKEGHFIVGNWDPKIGIDMRYKYNRWWIEK